MHGHTRDSKFGSVPPKTNSVRATVRAGLDQEHAQSDPAPYWRIFADVIVYIFAH